ncbi:MAG: hypothetical protein CL624_04860 [Arcobacter sp.]|nr:hypothetical protein [Arcobacter sp.]|tara:strand:+ start:8076 stop:9179 length:1104 start_codon:yes stop_codon:yes gene_type:complete
MKPKLLCILHRSPPAHGAAKVGDFIGESKKLKENFDCRFITIKSSDTIGDIGKVNIKKLYLVVELFIKVLFTLLVFRPQKLYFTSSISGVAFYRDLLVSLLWKSYKFFKPLEVYHHYHTKGIDSFVSRSNKNLKLTNFFIKDVNMMLLSPLLETDLQMVDSYKRIIFLPNGVEDSFKNEDINSYLEKKYSKVDKIQALYLAHMMKEKGYWDVLELALKTKNQNIHYHFAGSWKDEENKKNFFDFIKIHNLEKDVTYHGFVTGDQKKELFKKAHILLYPSKNDAFPLTLLESLSFGVPVIASNEGSISYILDEECGVIISNFLNSFESTLQLSITKFINKKSSEYCRKKFIQNFSLEQFEKNLIKALK